MTAFERFRQRCAERFGDKVRNIREIEGGGFELRLTSPDVRTGNQAAVFPIGDVIPGPKGERAESAETDTVTFSFSSETPCLNWWGEEEILSHHPEDADLSRMMAVGSILYNHNPNLITGVPVRVWISNQKGYCEERFGSTDVANKAKHEVLVDRTLRGISVGFLVKKWVWLEGENTNYREIRGTDEGRWVAAEWQALESSHTPVPADPSVGVGRSVNAGMSRTGGEMKRKVKLSRAWTDATGVEHRAGDVVEVDEATFQRLTSGDNPIGSEERKQESDGKQEPQEPAQRKQEPQATDGGQRAAQEPQGGQAFDFESHMRAERDRCKTIRELGKKHSVNVDALVDNGATVEQAREFVLEAITERGQNQPVGRATVTKDGIQSFREACCNSLRLRAGRDLTKEEREAGGDDLAGLSLIELARECRRRKGLPIPAGRDQLISETLFGSPRITEFQLSRAQETISTSTDDFPYILANVAHKEMLAGAKSARVTWRLWCKKGNLNDFKAHSRLKLSEAGDLEEIAEGEGYNHTKFSEQRENITLKTYGKVWNMTRQMMINDDVNAFTQVPFTLGRRAAFKPEILAVQVLLSNPTMADGVSLFDTSHSNYNAAAANNASDVDKARSCLQQLWELLMLQSAMQHSDLSDEVSMYLNSGLKVVLCGPSTYMYHAAALRSSNWADTNRDANPLQDLDITLVPNQLLENSLITGYSTTATYGFADPQESPVIEVGFLNGNESPYQEEVVNTGTSADGRVFKVRLDCVAGAIDYRGAVKENGA